jgi:endonuclease IV
MSKNKQLTANNFKQIADRVNSLSNNEAVEYILQTCHEHANNGIYAASFNNREYFTKSVIDELHFRGFNVNIKESQQGYTAVVSWSSPRRES